jgi:hypothetical protein
MAFGALATAGLDWLVRGGDLPVLVEDGTAQGMAALIAGLGHLAQRDLSFSQMLKVDRQLRALGQDRLVQAGLAPLRLAVLGSASLDHLLPGLRVAGARHGFALEIFRGDYGQYWHEIMDADGALRAFAPDAVLLALDAGHLVGEGFDPAGATRLEETFARLREGWASLIGATGAQVIQQAALPWAPALMGGTNIGWPALRRIWWRRSTSDCGARPMRPGSMFWRLTMRQRPMGWRPGMTGCCGSRRGRRSRRLLRSIMANWRCGWWRRGAAGRPSVWCSISTTRCGAG